MRITDRIYALLTRRRAYAACFQDERGEMTDEARAVFADLARFCRVHQTTIVVSPISRTVDTHASMLAEGRREVYNRICTILKITEEDLLASNRDTQESNDE